MRKLIHIVLLTLLGLLSPGLVKACSCREMFTPVCASYQRASAVFIGTLREIGERQKTSHETPHHFRVEKGFKGVTSREEVIDMVMGDCYDAGLYKIEEKYLIYAHRNRETGRLFLMPCARVVPLAKADADLGYIDNLMQKKVSQSISGLLDGLSKDDLKAVRISLIGEQLNVEPSSNVTESVVVGKSWGHYSADLPKIGTYRVRLTLPFKVKVYSGDPVMEAKSSQTTLEYTVTLSENQCDYREIYLVRVN